MPSGSGVRCTYGARAEEAAEKIRKADSSRAKSPFGIIKINDLDAGLKAGSTQKALFSAACEALARKCRPCWDSGISPTIANGRQWWATCGARATRLCSRHQRVHVLRTL